MLRFAANLSFQFTEVPFLERFACAAHAGFDAVEFNYVSGVDSRQISHQFREHQLRQVLAGMPGSSTDKGLAAIPGRHVEFRERLLTGLELAAEADCRLLHVTAGVVSTDEREQGAQAFIENIEYAVTVAAQFKVTLVVEAINQRDVPGYFIRSLDDALRWVDMVDDANFGLILDLYHAGLEGLPAPAAVAMALKTACHVQVAAVPTRHEPDPDCSNTLCALKDIAVSPYSGWVGCEYRPVNDTLSGLTWVDRLDMAVVSTRRNS